MGHRSDGFQRIGLVASGVAAAFAVRTLAELPRFSANEQKEVRLASLARWRVRLNPAAAIVYLLGSCEVDLTLRWILRSRAALRRLGIFDGVS